VDHLSAWRVVTTPAPAAKAALDQATKRWPGRSRASDGIVGDAAHRARPSDHNPDADGMACAFDLTHDPAHGCDAHLLADELRFLSKVGLEKRAKYIISRKRIATPPTWDWRRYTGTNPHESHIHVSITQEGKRDCSPWWIGNAPTEDDMAEPVDALQDPQGGIWVLSRDGAVRAYRGARTLGEPKGKDYWAGREADHLEPTERGYDVIAKGSGERYGYPS
jgi:hypothetical protein